MNEYILRYNNQNSSCFYGFKARNKKVAIEVAQEHINKTIKQEKYPFILYIKRKHGVVQMFSYYCINTK